MDKLIIILYLLVIALLCATACNFNFKKKFYVPMKIIASLSFLLIYVILRLMHGSAVFQYLMIPILLCFIGDIFMALYNTRRKKPFMFLGIATFMLAHVGFLSSLFYFDHTISIWNVLIPLACIPVTFLLIDVSDLHLGRIRPAAVAYSCFVGALMAKTVHIMIFKTLPDYLMIGIGGILFFISDLDLLFLYFYHFHNRNAEKTLHIFNLITYYAAMICLIYGLA